MRETVTPEVFPAKLGGDVVYCGSAEDTARISSPHLGHSEAC